MAANQKNTGFDLQTLWDATNNGLRFFQDEFSHVGKNQSNLKGFKVRPDDDTGSCHVSKSKKTGLYTFKDFGTNNKAVNAIDYVMNRDNCDFVEACKTLFQQYGLPLPELQKIEPITTFSSNIEKEVGFWDVEFYPKIQDEKTLKRLFPFATHDTLNKYDFLQVKKYENVDKSEKTGNIYHRTIEATEQYPIFGYDKQDFVKLYAPKAPKDDKFNLKHSFIGKKPDRFIYGWDRLFRKVDHTTIKVLFEQLKDEKDPKSRNRIKSEIKELQLDYVFIATGGTDGINIASLGYDVIWFNSESETITPDEYYQLSQIARTIVYVGDLDETGISQSVYIGMNNIECKLLWLPDRLLQENKKDFSDWIRNLSNEPIEKVQTIFRKMLSQALNFKFWSFNDKGTISLNEKKLLHFLKYQNIALYKTPYMTSNSGKEEEGFFVSLQDNIIQQVWPSDIKRVILNWLHENYHPIDVYNKVIRSAFFNQNQLKALPFFEYKKNSAGKGFQYYFFNNTSVKVTAEKIEVIPFSRRLKVNVWDDDRVKHDFNIASPFFEVKTDDLGKRRIKILSKNSNFFKVLINTSRIYWKKDATETETDTNPFGINSKKLTEEENTMQELHLLNKMYCIGYLLHQYKRASRAWMVLGVDFVFGESVKGSYGGTAKSFLQKSLFTVLNGKNIGGKTIKDDSFPMDGVTPKTRLVMFDDLPPYQDYTYFYNYITDNFTANQKGGVKYNIPFNDSPKIGGTTNFAPDMVPSTQRRLIVYHNSDYYHESTEDNDYLFSRKISDDFNGRDLFDSEYSESEYNEDFNFMLQCLQFYLTQPDKIEAPLTTLISKNHLMRIGDSYVKFFRELFSDEEMLNDWVEKSKIVAMAKDELGNKFISAQRFNDNLKMYVAAMKNEGWSIEYKKQKNPQQNSVPHFFISTTGEKAIDLQPELTEQNLDQDDKTIFDSDIEDF